MPGTTMLLPFTKPMSAAAPTFARRVGRCRWVAALAVVLVLAQSLGLLHRVAHAPGIGAHAATQGGIEAPGSAAHWLDALFAGHGDQGAECPLYDSLTQPTQPAATALAPSLPATCGPVATSHGDFVVRRTAPFQARGPPASR